MSDDRKYANHFCRSSAIDYKDKLYTSADIGSLGNKINKDTPGTYITWLTPLQFQLFTVQIDIF